eukprot:4379886-Pyramimonas_sp.AAC.1
MPSHPKAVPLAKHLHAERISSGETGSKKLETSQEGGCSLLALEAWVQIGTHSSKSFARAAWPAKGAPPSSAGPRTGSGAGLGPLLNL